MNANYGKIGTYFYVVGLCLIGIFIPTSKYFLSVSQFYLIVVWMLVGLDMRGINKMYPEKPYLHRLLSQIAFSFLGIWQNIRSRFTAFLHNKVAVIMVSMYLLHVLGLLYTADFQYAFKDLRIKLPILLFPIILSSMKPLNKKQFDTVLWLFMGSVFFVTVLGAIKFLRRDFVDVRELSVFVSHIRVSLCIVFSIFVLTYFLIKRNYPRYLKILIIILIVWFMWQISILESFISVIIIAAICVFFAMYFILKSNNKIFKIASLMLILVFISLGIYIPYNIIYDYNHPDKVVVEQLDTHTKLGNPYVFDTIHFGIEDGRYVGLYLAKDEMIEAWNQRTESDINADMNDLYTLVRYLTSKDLRKDAEGVAALDDNDVRNIENGIANFNYIENPGIKTRIMKVMVAYDNYDNNKDANGSSVFQRIEYIKASLNLIKDNPLIGVGTGDLNNAFVDYYEKTDSNLRLENRLRSHNQYLAITIAFGVFGLIWFLVSMFYPILSTKKNRNFLYFVFIFIIALSMLTEDTIESQIGVTLFAFLNSFLVFAAPSLGEDIEKLTN